MGVDVVAANGRRWSVRRRIAWPRWRDIDLGLTPLDALDVAGFGEGVTTLVFALILAVVGAIVIVVLLPFLFFFVEALLAVAAIGVLRGTWLIEATTVGPEPETRRWKVKAGRAASELSRRSPPSFAQDSKPR